MNIDLISELRFELFKLEVTFNIQIIQIMQVNEIKHFLYQKHLYYFEYSQVNVTST